MVKALHQCMTAYAPDHLDEELRAALHPFIRALISMVSYLALLGCVVACIAVSAYGFQFDKHAATIESALVSALEGNVHHTDGMQEMAGSRP